jgi:hypothetical protein
MSTHFEMKFYGLAEDSPNSFGTDFNGRTVRRRFAYLEWKMLDGSMMYPKFEIKPVNYHQVLGLLKGSISDAITENIALKVRLGLLTADAEAYVSVSESDLVLLMEYLRRDIVRALTSHLGADEPVIEAMAQIAPWCSIDDLLTGAIVRNQKTTQNGGDRRSSASMSDSSTILQGADIVRVPLNARVSEHYLESLCADQAMELNSIMKAEARRTHAD